MALALVAPEIVVPLQRGVGVARRTVGSKNYRNVRSTTTWMYGAVNGFSPIPPMLPLLPIKIALFIVILLICIFVFGMGFKSIVAAYLGQALIIMFASQWIMDNFLKWGVGI